MNLESLDEALDFLNESTSVDKLEKCIAEVHKFCDTINKKYNLKDSKDQQMKKCNSVSKSMSDEDTTAYKVFYINSDNFPDGDLWSDKVSDEIEDGFEKICKKYRLESEITDDNPHPSLTGYVYVVI